MAKRTFSLSGNRNISAFEAVRDDSRIEVEDGRASMHAKFPGVGAVELDRSQVGDLAAMLNAETLVGDDPVAVAQRTATEEPNGTISFRFSDEKGGRTITLTRSERDQIAGLLFHVTDTWDSFESDEE